MWDTKIMNMKEVTVQTVSVQYPMLLTRSRLYSFLLVLRLADQLPRSTQKLSLQLWQLTSPLMITMSMLLTFWMIRFLNFYVRTRTRMSRTPNQEVQVRKLRLYVDLFTPTELLAAQSPVDVAAPSSSSASMAASGANLSVAFASQSKFKTTH